MSEGRTYAWRYWGLVATVVGMLLAVLVIQASHTAALYLRIRPEGVWHWLPSEVEALGYALVLDFSIALLAVCGYHCAALGFVGAGFLVNLLYYLPPDHPYVHDSSVGLISLMLPLAGFVLTWVLMQHSKQRPDRNPRPAAAERDSAGANQTTDKEPATAKPVKSYTCKYCGKVSHSPAEHGGHVKNCPERHKQQETA